MAEQKVDMFRDFPKAEIDANVMKFVEKYVMRDNNTKQLVLKLLEKVREDLPCIGISQLRARTKAVQTGKALPKSTYQTEHADLRILYVVEGQAVKRILNMGWRGNSSLGGEA